jgi:hypothetical protein
MNVLFALLSIVGPFRPNQYLGPDTLMPLASILAAILGFFLIFWKLIVRITKKTYRKIRGLPDEVPPDLDAVDATEEKQDQ